MVSNVNTVCVVFPKWGWCSGPLKGDALTNFLQRNDLKKYDYIADADIPVSAGDIVVVRLSTKLICLALVVDVLYNTRTDFATKYIIDVVDFDSYNDTVAREKRAAAIKARLDEIAQQAAEIHKYRTLSKYSEEAKTLVTELETLNKRQSDVTFDDAAAKEVSDVTADHGKAVNMTSLYEQTDGIFLFWIHQRLKYDHGEDESQAFMARLRAIAVSMDPDRITVATKDTPTGGELSLVHFTAAAAQRKS